jgi:hypothetical protein
MARRTIPGWGRFEGVETRKVRFAGRTWTVARVSRATKLGDHLGENDSAKIDPENCVIVFRSIGSTEDALTSLLHEILHEVFPTASEQAVLAADSKMKDALEAFGVDLSPMLKGYK